MKVAMLVALAMATLEAQPIEVRSFSQIAPLDGPWKFTTGDDPRFAAADFDDSAWRTFRVPNEALRFPLGISWVRFQVRLPEPPPGEPLELLLPPMGTAYDLFVNGRLAGSLLDIVTSPAAFEIPSGSRTLTAAIRVRKDAALFSAQRSARGAWIGTANAIAREQHRVHLELRWRSVIHLSMMSATAMAGLFFVLVPVWRSGAREYFWCGLFLLGITLLRPFTVANWMLQDIGRSPFLVAVGLYGLMALTTHAWERTFRYLFGIRLSAWARRCQHGMLLLVLAAFSLATIFGAPIFRINAPLSMLMAAINFLVYFDLWRRGERREEAPWMHTAVAMALGGALVFMVMLLVAGLENEPVPDGADLQHLAYIVRGLGVMLFAGVMAMVLNRRSARLQREQERLAQEMRAGAEMQELLLPAGAIHVPGFTSEAVYLPMSEVGGDFYWVRAEPGGGLIVVMGDVSGKGLKAALLVSVVVGILRATQSSRPAAILGAVNDGLAGQMRDGFATCCCARFDPDGGVTIANAGHPGAYCDGREIEIAPELPLGVAQGVAYEETLVRGERFTFVSDGVVEAENADRELFGFERTREISTKPAREIAEAAKAWGQNDDITVVTVQKRAGA